MTMLRTNLATRPFYNERLVHWLIGGAAVLVVAFTAFNVSEYLRLSGRQGGLAADAARDEAMARTLTARAAEARRRIDAKSLERISAQAAEANGIIDARTFSWTALFDDIEATLPPTVMLTAITPSIGPGRRHGAAHRARPHRRGNRHLHRAARGDHPFRERAAVLGDRDRGGPVPDAGDGPLPDGPPRRRPPRRQLRRPRALRRPRRPAGRGRDDGPVARLRREAAPDPADRRRGALVNLVVYAVVIYPRTSSAGALEMRAQQAATARARAAADLRDAEAIRTGQERAAQQLARFYDSVLPKGQEGARRITYRRLATLADESNLDYDRRTIAIDQDHESALEQMDVTMVLEGEYRDVRRFIHKLETAPEFVVIENVAPGAGREERAADLDGQAVDVLQGGVVMEPAQRTRWIQLGILGVVLVAVVYFVLMPALATPVAPAGPLATAAPGGRAGGKSAPRPIDVRLDALGKAAAAEDPEGARRNPFRMGAATPPPAPEGTMAARTPPKPVAPVVMAPVGPPPPPPIPYRFIGVLTGVPGQGRIAVLTDGRSVVHGRVNDIIEGRYRIVQIGEESLQIEHYDGRGRQTIRLLGQ